MSEEKHHLAKEASSVIIHLLKGVLYADTLPLLWQNLLRYDGSVRAYLEVIGLEVVLDESEGFAFLRQHSLDAGEEGGDTELPRLIPRRALSFPVSMLCVLLRRKLAEADAGGGTTRVILSREQVIETLRVFLPESNNQARIADQIDAHLQKLVELGFLRSLKTEEKLFEVRRVVKALVDAQWLGTMSEKLEEYRKYARDSI